MLAVMPLYFLHVCDSNGFAEDDEGHELADLAAARRAAVAGLRDIMAGDLQSGYLNTACFVEIEDEQHDLLATISFADAVRISDEIQERPKA